MNPADILRLALIATSLVDQILTLLAKTDTQQDLELEMLGTDLAQARKRLQAAIAKREGTA